MGLGEWYAHQVRRGCLDPDVARMFYPEVDEWLGPPPPPPPPRLDRRIARAKNFTRRRLEDWERRKRRA